MDAREWLDNQRWIPVKNLNTGGAGTIPPYAVVSISVPYADGTAGASQITTDNTLDLGNIAFNGPTAIPADGFGMVTRDWPAIVYMNSGVFAGDYIGTYANQWYMDTSTNGGWRSWGMLDDGLSGGNRRGLVVPCINTIPTSFFGGFRPPRRLKVVLTKTSGPDTASLDGTRHLMTCYPVSSANSASQKWYGVIDVTIAAVDYRTYLRIRYPASDWRFRMASTDDETDDGTLGSAITPADPFSHTATGQQINGDGVTLYSVAISPWDDP